MLYTDVNEFNWIKSSVGDSASIYHAGTSMTTGAANTKGTAVTMLAGASVTTDVYAFAIRLGTVGTAGARRSFLYDLLIDEAGGTSWTVKIDNLLAHQEASHLGGYTYYFPVFIKSGTSIGVQAQCNVATITTFASIKLFGKPTKPELLKVGYRVETIGANTATTDGVSITPGNAAAWGSYASIGTPSNNNWWWQMGVTFTDTSMTALSSNVFEIAGGDDTNKKNCIVDVLCSVDSSENCSKNAFGSMLPIKSIPSGETIYARGTSSSTTADTGCSVVVYGVS